MENRRIADFAILIVLMLALVLAIAVSLLIFTFIFAWVADVVDNGYAVIHSVALVFSALIIATALFLRK